MPRPADSLLFFPAVHIFVNGGGRPSEAYPAVISSIPRFNSDQAEVISGMRTDFFSGGWSLHVFFLFPSAMFSL